MGLNPSSVSSHLCELGKSLDISVPSFLICTMEMTTAGTRLKGVNLQKGPSMALPITIEATESYAQKGADFVSFSRCFIPAPRITRST